MSVPIYQMKPLTAAGQAAAAAGRGPVLAPVSAHQQQPGHIMNLSVSAPSAFTTNANGQVVHNLNPALLQPQVKKKKTAAHNLTEFCFEPGQRKYLVSKFMPSFRSKWFKARER